ncbi:MAG: glycoside hydrolase [Acidobacteria bacterium]|nr:MAG: glycoside hydrolase [Acidobacteriota bacterium]
MKYLPILALTISAFFLQSAQLPDEKKFANSIGMEFVRVEPGAFRMGFEGAALGEQITKVTEFGSRRAIWVPEKGDFDEHPAHQVTISKPFYLGVLEVTNEQYEKFDPLHAYMRGKIGFSIDDKEAVVFVTWREAKAFCDWLAQKEGLPYRLPTEAEWEYACRAGTTTPFSTGQTLPAEFLKNPDNSWYPEPHSSRGSQEVVRLVVGQTAANPWGLFDMHGNVEEWCSDWYGPYEPNGQRDPVGRSDGDFKVSRGGSHGTVGFYLRSANRMGSLPDDRSHLIGFRVALGPVPETLPVVQPHPSANARKAASTRPSPDSSKPYFYGPREYVKIPPGSTGPLFSEHNHDPGIVECANGDLFAIWYSTVTERGREMTVASSRLRNGQDEWEPASLFWDAPDRNDHAPALWFDGDRTIYQFLGLSSAATWGPLAVIMRTSTDNGVHWTRARLIAPERGPRHQPVESVFRTREGYLVLPCDATPEGGGGTALLISRDGGKSWGDPGGTIAGIHAGVTQLRDGSLLAFGRGDTINGMMPKSVSTDMGRTWKSEASSFPPIGGGQRLVLLRLKEGPLFLGSFAPPGSKLGIQGLFGAVSYDEGKTWSKIKVISDGGPERELRTTDGRPFKMSRTTGEPRGYMSVCQGKNGVIHLISSINHYAFNLKWLEGDGVTR